jgi:hypothetical protein
MQEPREHSPRRLTWKQGFIAAVILATIVYVVVVVIYAPIGGEVKEEGDP